MLAVEQVRDRVLRAEMAGGGGAEGELGPGHAADGPDYAVDGAAVEGGGDAREYEAQRRVAEEDVRAEGDVEDFLVCLDEGLEFIG